MIEEWADISGYEGYQVSSFGRARSIDRIANDLRGKGYLIKGADLKPVMNNNGYTKILASFGVKRKQLMLHRLVAIAFIPNPSNLPEVNHKDRDRANNHKDNLEWSSKRENRTHSKMPTRKSSSFSGLSYRKDSKRWRVRLCKNNKIITIGNFNSEEDAAKAYLQALEDHGLTNKYAKAA